MADSTQDDINREFGDADNTASQGVKEGLNTGKCEALGDGGSGTDRAGSSTKRCTIRPNE